MARRARRLRRWLLEIGRVLMLVGVAFGAAPPPPPPPPNPIVKVEDGDSQVDEDD